MTNAPLTPDSHRELRDRIARALANADGLELGETQSFPFLHEGQVAGYHRRADAVLAVLTAPAERAAALREAAAAVAELSDATYLNVAEYPRYDVRQRSALIEAAALLRRLAAEEGTPAP